MEIELCGYKVQIDEEDYERVMALKWGVDTSALRRGLGVYFIHTYFDKFGIHNKYNIYLHRHIMHSEYKDGIIIDHKDGNTLDNRKSNLRRCNRTENNRNRKISKVNTSGYKGVDFCKSNKKYQARIAVDNVRIHLGYFKTPEEAYAAYCEASNKYHGDFGRVK